MTYILFSRQEIEIIANRAFDGEQIQVLNYRLEKYSKDKVGYMGNHQNLEITIKRHGKSEPDICRFFVKSIPQLVEEQVPYIHTHSVFSHEAIYFNDILPLLKASCPDTQEWCPKCLLASDKFVVLEDMRLRHYATSNTTILSENQLYEAFKAQARLHAASLVAEKQLGKPLNEVYPKGFVEVIFTEMLKSTRLPLYTDLAEKVAERLGHDGRRLRAGLRQGFDQIIHDQSQLSTKLPKVIVHDDAWPNNYLFDSRSDPPKCVLVDFQLTRFGPPMYDVTMLMYLSTTREFREKVIRKAIEAYYEQFCEVLEKNNLEIKKPTLEDFLEEYEELRATALLCAIKYFPVLAVDKSTVAKYGEEEFAKKLLCQQDNSFVMQIYDEDKLFSARINEVIEEAVEYFEQRGVPLES